QKGAGINVPAPVRVRSFQKFLMGKYGSTNVGMELSHVHVPYLKSMLPFSQDLIRILSEEHFRIYASLNTNRNLLLSIRTHEYEFLKAHNFLHVHYRR